MVRNSNDAYDMFQHELWKWGIIQHSERGWYHMDAEAESALQTSNIEPDTWIEEESWWKYHDKQYDLQQSTRVGKLKCQDGQSKEYTVASNATDCADVRR